MSVGITYWYCFAVEIGTMTLGRQGLQTQHYRFVVVDRTGDNDREETASTHQAKPRMWKLDSHSDLVLRLK